VPRKHEQGDAIVVFGVTGDLAFKQIIPALQRMVQTDELNVPVVGVARDHWTPEKLDERIRDSLIATADGLDPAAYEKLYTLVRYVRGTYDDPRTYVALSGALEGARCPVHYLAIPPELFPTVIDQLGKVGLADRGRVVVEKPFGRDLKSSRTLNQALHRVFPEERCFRMTTTSASRRSRTSSSSVSPTRSSNRSGTANTSTRSRSRWPRTSTCPRGALSTMVSARFVT
jgi:glucose-6-phosphate 1-dehydrogenase